MLTVPIHSPGPQSNILLHTQHTVSGWPPKRSQGETMTTPCHSGGFRTLRSGYLRWGTQRRKQPTKPKREREWKRKRDKDGEMEWVSGVSVAELWNMPCRVSPSLAKGLWGRERAWNGPLIKDGYYFPLLFLTSQHNDLQMWLGEEEKDENHKNPFLHKTATEKSGNVTQAPRKVFPKDNGLYSEQTWEKQFLKTMSHRSKLKPGIYWIITNQ